VSASLRERLLRSHLLVGTIGVAVVIAAVVAVVYARDATVRFATETQPIAAAATRAAARVAGEADAPARGQLRVAAATHVQQRMRGDAALIVRTIDTGLAILVALFVAATAGTLAISLHSADRITRPLAALAAATTAPDRAHGDGGVGADVPVESDDEIGTLTRSFNRLRASVVDAERALSRRAGEALRAHEALAAEMVERTQAEAMFRQLLEATPDAILIVDRTGTIVLVNAATERLVDRPRQELVGAGLGGVLPAALQWTVLGTAPDGSAAPDAEILALRRDESTVPVDVRVNPLVLDGRTLFAIAARDVTERHRIAQTLRDVNAVLERRVRERTAELERSNEELERFAAVASHDLQEPLRMVASYTQLLGDRYRDRLDADADELIAFAVDGAQRMQRLVRDLLAYARVSSRAREPELVDPAPILARALENLRLAIAERAAVVTADPLPRVRADAVQLGQVLQNLVDNALKFASDAPPRVHVGAEIADDACVLSVRDNGIGIPADAAERAFGLFERLQRDARRPGSGLGLALCRKIVERHGGRMWIEPAPSGGTVVRFTLPYRSEVPAADRAA
jgi:PAS domain S-box-containing protein